MTVLKTEGEKNSMSISSDELVNALSHKAWLAHLAAKNVNTEILTQPPYSPERENSYPTTLFSSENF